MSGIGLILLLIGIFKQDKRFIKGGVAWFVFDFCILAIGYGLLFLTNKFGL